MLGAAAATILGRGRHTGDSRTKAPRQPVTDQAPPSRSLLAHIKCARHSSKKYNVTQRRRSKLWRETHDLNTHILVTLRHVSTILVVLHGVLYPEAQSNGSQKKAALVGQVVCNESLPTCGSPIHHARHRTCTFRFSFYYSPAPTQMCYSNL